MAKDFAKQFYGSTQWKKCRAAFISERKSIDGGMCMECQEEFGFIVHHKTSLTAQNIDDPYVTLRHSNLMYVCKNCHEKKHGNVKQTVEDMPRYIFDGNGNTIRASD